MTLQRSIIRAKAQTILRAANIVPSGNVFRAKVWPTKPQDLPCIVIFTRTDDQTSKGKTAAPEFDAQPTIDFEIGHNGDDPQVIEDELDAMCEQLINALMTNAAFVGLVEEIKSIKTAIDMKEGEFQYARARISFTFAYTEIYEPAPFPALNLIDAKFVDPKGEVFAEARISPQP